MILNNRIIDYIKILNKTLNNMYIFCENLKIHCNIPTIHINIKNNINKDNNEQCCTVLVGCLSNQEIYKDSAANNK